MTATIGATVITDTLALVVLALVTASFETGGGFGFLEALLPGLAALGFLVLWVLPKLTHWFFAGIGQDRTVRFLFVLTAFLVSAVAAEVVGVEGIVGAFLAGLALNRTVPNGGALMQRVDFVGSALLVPIFLISVGMLIDVSVVLDANTLLLAMAFAAAAMFSKWIAAEISGRLFSFGRAQIGVMFALSNSQAAATLAATIVGFELGLIDERVVNAVLIVILVTVIVSSLVASRSAHRVVLVERTTDQVGRVVLTPVARPETMIEILRLGAWIARADGGRVVPFHVVTSPEPEAVAAAEPLMLLVNETAGRLGADVDTFVRVDRSVAAGVVHTVAEREATLVVLGWKGERHPRIASSEACWTTWSIGFAALQPCVGCPDPHTPESLWSQTAPLSNTERHQCSGAWSEQRGQPFRDGHRRPGHHLIGVRVGIDTERDRLGGSAGCGAGRGHRPDVGRRNALRFWVVGE